MNNNETIKKDSDSKKILTMFILIATLMVCTTSATYAYFALTATNNVATGTAATASLTLTVTQADLKTGTNTGVMVPQRETALATAMNSTNKCVDANGNIICKVYTITVTNNSSAAVKVNGTIQFAIFDPDSEDGITTYSMANLKWKRATSATTLGTSTGGSYNGIAVGNISTSTASSTFDLVAGTTCTVSSGDGCTDVSLAANNGTTTYYIVIWINAPMSGSTEQAQTDSGAWRATINFQGENGTGITSTITS